MLPHCLRILLASIACGFLFNWLMPQGIGFLPEEVSNPLWQPIALNAAFKRLNRGSLFVDARDPIQYKQAHILNAINLPPADLDLFFPILKQQLSNARSIVVYGRTFSSWPAATIAQYLRKQGINKVYVLHDTFVQWKEAGYPTSNKSA